MWSKQSLGLLGVNAHLTSDLTRLGLCWPNVAFVWKHSSSFSAARIKYKQVSVYTRYIHDIFPVPNVLGSIYTTNSPSCIIITLNYATCPFLLTNNYNLFHFYDNQLMVKPINTNHLNTSSYVWHYPSRYLLLTQEYIWRTMLTFV